MKNKPFYVYVFLIFCVVTAFLLRTHLLSSRLFFGPEQGRDFLVIRDIVNNHKLTLIGSKTDIDGLFHGPIYYYLATIPFVFSSGNPLGVSLFFIALYSVTVCGMYMVTFEITKNVRTSAFSAVLYTVSYGVIASSRWLSNPPLSIPFSVLYMFFTVRLIQKKYLSIIGVVISYALLGQAELINFVLFGTIGLIVLVRYRATLVHIPKPLMVIAGILLVVLSIGNFALFNVKHEFLITNSILRLLHSGTLSKPLLLSFVEAFRMLCYRMATMVGLVSWESGAVVSVSIAYCLVRLRNRSKVYDLVIIWILIPTATLALLRHGVLEQLYIGSFSAYIVAISIASAFALEKNKLLGYALALYILIQNMVAYVSYLPKNQHVFFQVQQLDVRFSDQLQVIDGIYARAKGRNFQIQSYTIPYFLQDGWIYLFWYEGTRTYGYIPQNGESDLLYVIIQKDRLNPKFQNNWYTKTVSTWGKKSDVFQVGEFTVEELLTKQI